MDKTQCKMARAALGWSASELAVRAGVGYATAARFEAGGSINDDSQGKLRHALEAGGVLFTRRAGRIGATVPERE